jgi:hypothetical protein
MSRRFNDQPVNLIWRIPSPEQLSAARPMKQSFGQKFMETGAAFIRSAKELFAPATRSEPSSAAQAEAAAVSPDLPAEQHDHDNRSGAASSLEHVLPEPAPVVVPFVQNATTPNSSAAPTGTQLEEVAELRAYLLSQQQDIARLAAQVQELKSLVISQRQVLVYLGKELEAGSVSRMTESIASAVAKRSRPVRQKPAVKASEIKEKAGAQDNNPMQSSLNV